MWTVRLSLLAITALVLVACTAARQNAVTQQPTMSETIILAPTCTIPDRPSKRGEPGATHINTTFIGRDTQGRRMAWDIKVLSIKKPGCITPQVTDLVLEVEAADRRSFVLFDQDWKVYGSGTVGNDGRITIRFPLPTDDVDYRYFRLLLDTSGAYNGQQFVVKMELVEYEIAGKPYRYYQQRPPLLSY